MTDFQEEKLNIIRLSRTQGLTNQMFRKSIAIYGSATNIVKNIDSVFKKASNIKLCDLNIIEKELEELSKNNSKILTYIDEEYPNYLKNIDSYPLTITCRGNLDLLKNERKLAIIGSRNCSINNFNFTKKTARDVSDYGYVIVSGMAKGIDSAAHIGSIENGTIAVLGGDINNIYPKENEYLYYEILDKNGLIISEFPLGTRPKPENFPMRNRIIAGLSRGILIVSAGLKSGTIHTANQAIKYGREVLVFPGSPYDEGCVGSNKLLQQGATMVIDIRDIIESLEKFMPLNMNENSLSFNDDKINFEEKYYNNDDLTQDKAENLEQLILSKLDFVPIEVGELLDNLDADVSEINSTISYLNLNGKVIMESGKICLRKL